MPTTWTTDEAASTALAPSAAIGPHDGADA
jgi:hypothetical protein